MRKTLRTMNTKQKSMPSLRSDKDAEQFAHKLGSDPDLRQLERFRRTLFAMENLA
jgi:hypothetical protein